MTNAAPVHDTICQVISLLQAQCLAMDSALDAELMWGAQYMRTSSFELAIKMLINVLDEVEGR